MRYALKSESLSLGLETAADLKPFPQFVGGDGGRGGQKMRLSLPDEVIQPALPGDLPGAVKVQFKVRLLGQPLREIELRGQRRAFFRFGRRDEFGHLP